MPSVPSIRPRIALLGCVLAAAAAFALSGCGDNGTATAESAATTPAQVHPELSAKARATSAGCPHQVDAFVNSLATLRRQLATGLSYEQYAAMVKELNGRYAALPINRLTIGCVSTTGTPAEDALNKYIDATNAWGDCLADASCSTATIEPTLQRKWRVAARLLSAAP
jgi:hypothetical protein